MDFERFSPVERVIEIDGHPVRIWRPPDMEALIDLAAFAADERIPYWADVWESAIVLAEDLARLAGGGRSLLELGCGLGLPSLVAARAGFAVTATDYEADALAGVRYNAARNGLTGIATQVLDWRDPATDIGRFDFVVAADVLYEPHHAAALAGLIDRTLAADGTALVADPCRMRAAGFPDACRAVGLTATKTRARRPHGATDGPRVEVHAIARASHPWPRPLGPGEVTAEV